MKFALAQSTVSLIFLSSVVSALPQSPSTLFRRQGTSPDGTCGGSNNYHCPSSAPCCSQWGWCGTSVDHCGAGCQPQFGNCNGGGTDPPTGTSMSLPPTTSSTTSSLATSLSTSTSTGTSSVSTGSLPATSSMTSSTTTSTSGTPQPTNIGNPREKFGSVPYGVIITECARPNTVAITFDDGPHIYTETLLNHFAAAGAKATFFLNGQNWGPVITDGAKQALVRRMIAEGHQVASHTWSHPDLSTLSYDGVRTQMMQLETALISIMGKYPTYMRPPYLSCGGTCQQALGDLGYHIMSTNLDTLDWQYNTPDTYWQSQNIFKQAVTPVGNNGRWLVLSHDVHQMTAENIGRYMIKKSREIGLQIVTVGECMNDPPENWYRTVQ